MKSRDICNYLFALLWVLEWNGVIKAGYARTNHLL